MSDAAAARPLEVDRRALVLVALLALAASAPSLLNGFAYDDNWIIVTNGRVHSLARWADWFSTSYWPTREGSLYRPLTTMGFALQWWIGHGTPFVFHAINVALYVAGVVVFTRLAGLLLPAAAAIIVGALFAVHPTHVEAVANGVGQSELSAGLVMLLATYVYIKARRAGPLTRRTVAGLTALYLLGALLKEHAMTLPAWFLIAELTVLKSTREGLRYRVTALVPLFSSLAVVAVAVFAVRLLVLGALSGDIPHPAFRDVPATGRVLIMFGVLPDLARLLVWPAQLFADYSPEQVRISATPTVSQLNGLVVVIGAVLITAIAWKRSAVAAFGLLVAAAAWLPTANIVFPSGILLSERTLYLPTAGVLLAAGVAMAWLIQRYAADAQVLRVAGGVLGLVLLLGVARSADRAPAWRSSADIFWTMRRDEPDSFRARYAWGSVLFDRGDLLGGEREWRSAMRIFPYYPYIYEDLAHKYREHRLCHAAIPLYERALRIDEALLSSRQGLIVCQLALAQYSAARVTARIGIAQGELADWYRKRLFSADSALAATDSVRK